VLRGKGGGFVGVLSQIVEFHSFEGELGLVALPLRGHGADKFPVAMADSTRQIGDLVFQPNETVVFDVGFEMVAVIRGQAEVIVDQYSVFRPQTRGAIISTG